MRTGASLFLRADGRWEARYQKGRNESGRIVYGFVYGATKEEAERKRAEAIRQLHPDADRSTSSLPSLNPNLSSLPESAPSVKSREKIEPCLDDQDAALIDICLTESRDIAAIGFYLCLHMGLSMGELLKLKYGHIKFAENRLRIPSGSDAGKEKPEVVTPTVREMVLPTSVKVFLEEHEISKKNPKHYVLTDSETAMTGGQAVGAAFRRILKPRMKPNGLSVNSLRSTFIRRCLESNLNIESVSLLTGMEKAILYRYYGRYIKADPNAILRLDSTAQASTADAPKKLNLLIIGAGSHGHSVKETAEKIGVFQKIKFLDDRATGENILGSCTDYKKYLQEYPAMFPAFGDNELRRTWIEKLREAGALLPRIIHPDTTISSQAFIEDATIILSQVTINAGVKIGHGVIVAANSIIGYDAEVGDYAHLDSGVILQKDARVKEMVTVECGEIVKANHPAGHL